jgi:hypothetical protein
VAWTTNEPSTSTVSYGTSAASLGSSFGNSVLVTAHALTVPGLTPGTQYFYRVTSADAAANSATSPVPPATSTFTTTAFTVSGAITPAAMGGGTTVTLTGGAAPATFTADTSGNYQFSSVLNGSYTVTPSMQRLRSSRQAAPDGATVSGASVAAVDFTASRQVPTFSISGTVSPASGGSGSGA